jgi:DNA-binding transcriptional MerR regulator
MDGSSAVTVDDGYLSTEELIAGTSITFRQLDYWNRKGVLFPADWTIRDGGSGSRRRWTIQDRARIVALDEHLRWLRSQHLNPTVAHLRQWWESVQAANGG